MTNQYPQYDGNNPWAMPQQQQQYQAAQPGVFVPQQPGVPSAAAPGQYGGGAVGYGASSGGGFAAGEPFLSGVAGNVLRQQGQSYLQRSQAFMQSKMGFLSGGVMHYLFAVTPEYVRSKLLMLLFPFLKKWNYVRVAEQLSGGHKYLPPRQDVNAPDMYIPVMALWTYCLLVGVALFAGKSFKPEILYSTVTSAIGAWMVHALMLKMLLWMLGISSTAAFSELTAYAGYPFVVACVVLLAHLVLGRMGYHVVWAYGSLCMAIFLVRTMKRVIFLESSHYSHHASRHNYLLLGLATFQFPFLAWLSRIPV